MDAILHLMPLLLIALSVALALLAWGARQRRVQLAIDAGFEGLRITDGEPPLRGADLRVVAERRMLMTAQSQDGFGPTASHEVRSEYFLYCVGPGPSWFLVIALVNDRGWWRTIDVDWIVRPLDDARMRGALVGDAEALRAAGLIADT